MKQPKERKQVKAKAHACPECWNLWTHDPGWNPGGARYACSCGWEGTTLVPVRVVVEVEEQSEERGE